MPETISFNCLLKISQLNYIDIHHIVQIGVEEMLPSVVEEIEGRGGFFNELIGAFSKEQLSAGRAMRTKLGISRKEAETESEKFLKGTDFKNSEIRLKLIAFLLAAYDYDSAVLQWSYLPNSVREKQTLIPKNIAEQMSKSSIVLKCEVAKIIV